MPAKKNDKSTVKATSLNINLPFGIGAITLEPNTAQQDAAWKLYVELTTRITLQPLDDDHGLLREALNSIYKIFDLTRDILKAGGPALAEGSDTAFGFLALRVLNDGLRPFNAKWHPLLKEYEDNKSPMVSAVEHEKRWEHNAAMRAELKALQTKMQQYTGELARIAQIELTA
jgi:hypothetical protein